MTQVDLFGNPIIDEPAPAAPYRVIPMDELYTKGCAECRHVKEPPPKCKMSDWVWVCKITMAPVDPDNGTCGRWEAWT